MIEKTYSAIAGARYCWEIHYASYLRDSNRPTVVTVYGDSGKFHFKQSLAEQGLSFDSELADKVPKNQNWLFWCMKSSEKCVDFL